MRLGKPTMRFHVFPRSWQGYQDSCHWEATRNGGFENVSRRRKTLRRRAGSFPVHIKTQIRIQEQFVTNKRIKPIEIAARIRKR